MAWLAVDKNNTEWVYKYKPERESELDFWYDTEDSVELPKGSIKKLIGRDLTWNDAPVELK